MKLKAQLKLNGKYYTTTGLKLIYFYSVGQSYHSNEHTEANFETIEAQCSQVKFLLADKNKQLKYQIWGKPANKINKTLQQERLDTINMLEKHNALLQTRLSQTQKQIIVEIPKKPADTLSNPQWLISELETRASKEIKLVRDKYDQDPTYKILIKSVAQQYVSYIFASMFNDKNNKFETEVDIAKYITGLEGKSEKTGNERKKIEHYQRNHRRYLENKEKYIEESINDIITEIGVMRLLEKEFFQDKSDNERFNGIVYPISESKVCANIYQCFIKSYSVDDYKPQLPYVDSCYILQTSVENAVAFDDTSVSNSTSSTSSGEGTHQTTPSSSPNKNESLRALPKRKFSDFPHNSNAEKSSKPRKSHDTDSSNGSDAEKSNSSNASNSSHKASTVHLAELEGFSKVAVEVMNAGADVVSLTYPNGPTFKVSRHKGKPAGPVFFAPASAAAPSPDLPRRLSNVSNVDMTTPDVNILNYNSTDSTVPKASEKSKCSIM